MFLQYLKIHCRDNIDHRKDLNKCIFNYDLPDNYIEIEVLDIIENIASNKSYIVYRSLNLGTDDVFISVLNENDRMIQRVLKKKIYF